MILVQKTKQNKQTKNPLLNMQFMVLPNGQNTWTILIAKGTL